MPGRKYSNGNQYAYGFNGKRKDDEMYGEGNAYDFGNRILDPRLGGRWLSVDPLQQKYPGESPYLHTGGNPIIFSDPDGRDRIITITTVRADGKTTVIQKIDKNDFNYYAGNTTGTDGLGGGVGFYKADIVQNLFIDERGGTPAMVYTEDQKVNPQQIAAWDYSVFSDFIKSGDESEKIKYGYMTYGKSKGMEHSDKLPRAAGGSETLDLSSFLDMVGAMREGASIEDVYKRVGGNEVALKLIKAVEHFNGNVERIDAIIEAKKKLESDNNTPRIEPGKTERNDLYNKKPPVKYTNEGKPAPNARGNSSAIRKTPPESAEPDTIFYDTPKKGF